MLLQGSQNFKGQSFITGQVDSRNIYIFLRNVFGSKVLGAREHTVMAATAISAKLLADCAATTLHGWVGI